MRHVHSSVLLIFYLATLKFTVASLAEQPPKHGNFRVLIEQKGSWEGFPIANKYWVWIARRSGVFEGNGPLNGMTSRCISKGTTAYGILKAEIHCENTDADGDKIFEVSKEECACGPGGDGGKGNGEFLGGTGKYLGIKGTFEIERRVGSRDRENRTWTDQVVMQGNWSLP